MYVRISWCFLISRSSLAVNSNKGNSNQMPPTSAASANWQTSPPNLPNSQPNNNGAPTSNGQFKINLWFLVFLILMFSFFIAHVTTIIYFILGTNNGGNGNNGGNNPPNSSGNSNGPTVSGNGNNGNNANSTSSAKIEQFSTMREALFSQDGWGGVSIK